MSLYKKAVLNTIEEGMHGQVTEIPLGIDRLNEELSIWQAHYYLLGGNTGSGKTAFVDDKFVISPYDWVKKNREETGIDIRILYRSMERKKEFKFQKWTCYKLYQDYNIIVDPKAIRNPKKFHMSQETYDKICELTAYFEEMEDYITIIDGSENPTGIYNQCIAHAKEYGTIHTKEYIDSDGKPHDVFDGYTPNNPKMFTIIVIDHIGKTSTERMMDERAKLNKTSEYMGEVRDMFSFTPVVVSQFNRSLGDINRLKMFKGDLSPQLEDFEGTARTQHDADVILALFNPYRYKVYNDDGEYMDYNLMKLVTPRGLNRFRSLSLLKNSYGVDDIQIGLRFTGEMGHFSALPRSDEELELQNIYNQVANGN